MNRSNSGVKRRFMDSKKYITLLAIMIITSASVIPKQRGCAATYKKTEFSSFASVKKYHYKKSPVGICYATKKVKTKYGEKNALMICDHYGFTDDCNCTYLYIKKGKKVYQLACVEGVVRAVSKNRKYLFSNGSGAFGSVYKYTGGKYKKIKYILAKNSDFMKEKEKLRHKYKLDDNNIKYKVKCKFD